MVFLCECKFLILYATKCLNRICLCPACVGGVQSQRAARWTVHVDRRLWVVHRRLSSSARRRHCYPGNDAHCCSLNTDAVLTVAGYCSCSASDLLSYCNSLLFGVSEGILRRLQPMQNQGGNYQIWSGGSESPQPMTRHNSIAFQNRISDCRAHETSSFSHYYQYFHSFGIN